MEHIWKFQEFCNSMTRLETDSYEYAYLKAIVLFSPGENSLIQETYLRFSVSIQKRKRNTDLINSWWWCFFFFFLPYDQITQVWTAVAKLRSSKKKLWWSCKTMCKKHIRKTHIGQLIILICCMDYCRLTDHQSHLWECFNFISDFIIFVQIKTMT